MAALEHEAALGQGVGGPLEHDRQDRGARPQRQLERAGLEGAQAAVRGARALREHHDRAAVPQRALTRAQHRPHALAASAHQLDVAVVRHVPADQGHTEVLDFRHPLEVGEESEHDQDVEQGQVVGDHDVGRVGTHSVAAAQLDRPGRVRPGVERGPEAGEAVEQDAAPVEGAGGQPDEQRDRIQADRAQRQEAPEHQRGRHPHAAILAGRAAPVSRFPRFAPGSPRGCGPARARTRRRAARAPGSGRAGSCGRRRAARTIR